jgi:hypothetical protein
VRTGPVARHSRVASVRGSRGPHSPMGALNTGAARSSAAERQRSSVWLIGILAALSLTSQVLQTSSKAAVSPRGSSTGNWGRG